MKHVGAEYDDKQCHTCCFGPLSAMRSTNFSTVSALTCVFKSVRLSLSNERRHSVAPLGLERLELGIGSGGSLRYNVADAPTLLPALICLIKTVIVGLRLNTRSWPCV